MSDVHFSARTFHNDIVDEQAIRNHIAKKAGYEPHGKGVYQSIGRFNRFCNWVMGNSAIERYKRSYFESNQHAAAALVAARYRAVLRGGSDDLNEDVTLKSRVYRNDFIRYNPGLRNGARKSITGKSDPEKPFMTLGKSGRNRWAMYLTRTAHITDGVNELAAAPTGLSVKLSKILITPTMKDHSLGSYARLLTCLPVIAIGVSAVIFGLVTKAIGMGWAACAPATAASLLAKLDAVAGLLGGITYLLGLGSAALMKEDRLTDPLMTHIDNNRQRYMHRLVRVLRGAIGQPGGLHMFRVALNIKNKADSPRAKLFNGLLEAVKNNLDMNAAVKAVEEVLGRHFTMQEGLFELGGKMLDASDSKDRRTLASRERDFVKIANLMEHARTELHIGDDGFQNLRTNIEKGATWLRGKLDKLAASKATRVKPREQNESLFSVDRILSNPHQYAWWVRGAASAVKLAYVLSFGVAMSTNYLLTRPFAALHRTIERWYTGGIHSRSLSFSFGRFVAGFAWAALFFASGGTITGVELFKLGPIPVNMLSTAIQMLGLSGLGALASVALVGALRFMGGYKGDSKAPIKFTTAPRGMPPVRWV